MSATKITLPFKLIIHDKNMLEIECPEVLLELDEPTDATCHWDRIAKLEEQAKEMLIADCLARFSY